MTCRIGIAFRLILMNDDGFKEGRTSGDPMRATVPHSFWEAFPSRFPAKSAQFFPKARLPRRMTADIVPRVPAGRAFAPHPALHFSHERLTFGHCGTDTA